MFREELFIEGRMPIRWFGCHLYWQDGEIPEPIKYMHKEISTNERHQIVSEKSIIRDDSHLKQYYLTSHTVLVHNWIFTTINLQLPVSLIFSFNDKFKFISFPSSPLPRPVPGLTGYSRLPR